jgi:chromosome segregation ATPase
MVAATGLTLLAIGGLKTLPPPVARVSETLRRAPLAVGLSLAGVLAGSSFGLLGTIAVGQQAAKQCSYARAQYAAQAKGEDFASTRTAIGAIERDCAKAVAGPELATMRSDVEAKEAAAKKRKDAEETARRAKEAAEKEKNAVETFPDKSKEIAAMITATQAKVWQGKVEAADQDYDTAQRQLDAFKGTSIEETKGFTDLGAQIAEKKKAIQPQIERIKEARRKTEEAAAEKARKIAAAAEEKQRKEEALATLKAAIRGDKPINSAWDGSVSAVERYLKSALHDPGSYDHIRTSVVVGEGDYWVVVSSFRGKNAFGALVINTKKFFIQQGQVVKTSDAGGDDD